MKTLAIDIETYSSVSIQKCGVYAYSSSHDFEVLLFGYAWDDGPVEVIDLAQGQKLPQDVLDALCDSQILKTAFNASWRPSWAYLCRPSNGAAPPSWHESLGCLVAWKWSAR